MKGIEMPLKKKDNINTQRITTTAAMPNFFIHDILTVTTGTFRPADRRTL